MWFQTCMHFFLLRNTKDVILEKAAWEPNNTKAHCTHKKTSSFMLGRRKFLRDLRVSE